MIPRKRLPEKPVTKPEVCYMYCEHSLRPPDFSERELRQDSMHVIYEAVEEEAIESVGSKANAL